MKIHNKSMSARDAADYFAQNMQDEARKVGTIVNAPGCAMKFQLVGGIAWYSVRCLPDYSGWEVTRD